MEQPRLCDFCCGTVDERGARDLGVPCRAAINGRAFGEVVDMCDICLDKTIAFLRNLSARNDGNYYSDPDQ